MRINFLNIPKAFQTLDHECRRHVGSIAFLSFGRAVAAIGNAFAGHDKAVERIFEKQEREKVNGPEISMKPIVVARPHRKGNKLVFDCNEGSAELVKSIAQWAVYSNYDKIEAQRAKVEYKNGRVLANLPGDFDEEHPKFKNLMRVVDAINNLPAKTVDDAICEHAILFSAVNGNQKEFESAFKKFAADMALLRNA
jgi:hypothetical protein